MNEVLDNLPENLPRLRKVARLAENPESDINSIHDLKMRLISRNQKSVVVWLLVFIAVMLGVLIWLNIR